MKGLSLNMAGLPGSWQESIISLRSQAAAIGEKLISKTIEGQEWTGWFQYPKQHGFEQEAHIQEMLRQIKYKYNAVVLVGVGGSYLGTAGIYDALAHSFVGDLKNSNQKKLFMLGHHLSEEYTTDFFEILDQYEPLVVLVSKSGTTLEPSIATHYIEKYMQARYGNAAAERIFAVTDPEKGVLLKKSRQAGYKTFAIPSDVGGRFSVFTPVGLLPLAFLGVDTKQLLMGADAVFQDFETYPQQLAIFDYAIARYLAHDAGFASEAMLYGNPKLGNIVEWWKQLFGESEGKQGKGLLPVGVRLTTDLHSLGQYLQDGKRNILGTFLYVEKVKSSHSPLQIPTELINSHDQKSLTLHDLNLMAADATFTAYTSQEMPCLQIRMEQVDAYHLGALLAFFECACAVSAGFLDVNAYDQPGVEVYKSHLIRLMQGQSK